MNERNEIGKRIKELRRKRKLSQSYVAAKLFISQSGYSLIENSQNGIVVEHIIKLSTLYNVTSDYILKGEKNLIKVCQSTGFMPFIKADAHAGFIKNYGAELSVDEYDWYKIPGFNPTVDQKLFEIEGESMVPTILPRDIVICQTQKNLNNVLDGSVVVIITSKNILAKRLGIDSNPDFFILENDNPAEPEKVKIKKSEILELMIVRGKISDTLVPHHQIASKGKIQAMEETLELLKKELYAISKKLNASNQK